MRKKEDDLAWTYDYIPTSVGDHGNALDQYGVRIQRATRPPYIHPDVWKDMKGSNKPKEIGVVEESEVADPGGAGNH